ncbi:hypothetical protein BT63DRAFT_359158, partial [Microthyrium microscopicum]
SRESSYSGNSNLMKRVAPTDGATLPEHLYTRGLLGGRHSDITILAFNNQYNLHRLILDRAPFFTLALSEPWSESTAREVPLYPGEVDPAITQQAFELALKRLYGLDISEDEDEEAVGLFATGCWLEMQELIDSAVASILRQLCPENLATIIKLVTQNCYGRPGDRILASAKAMLCRDGWDMPLKYWDEIPGHVVQDVVSSDGFFVLDEWERWNHCRKLLDRRLKQQYAIDFELFSSGFRPKNRAPMTVMQELVRFNPLLRPPSPKRPLSGASSITETEAWLSLYTAPDVASLLELLDEGIHYIHLEFEQLQHIRQSTDIFGLPVVPESIILNALYTQMELRQKVMNTPMDEMELGITNALDLKGSDALASDSPEVTEPKGKQRESTQTPSLLEEPITIINQPPKARRFWIPSSDCTMVMGGNADPVVSTGSGPSALRIASRFSAAVDPPEVQWTSEVASTPFGNRDLTTRPRTPGGHSSTDPPNLGQPTPNAYSKFPPFRFSAEFPAPKFLKEKKRVYSRTVFYAGSLWNIYIQKMRSAKQNFQLGVYLHRAKERDPDELTNGNGPTTVDERIGHLEREMRMGGSDRHSLPRRSSAGRSLRRLRNASMGNQPPANTSAGRSSSTLNFNDSPSAASTMTLYSRRARDRNSMSRFSDSTMQTFIGFDSDSSDSDSSGQLTALEDAQVDADAQSMYAQSMYSIGQNQNPTYIPPRISAVPSYSDSRQTIRTYFKIYSPSKGGRLLSVYESAPDQFDFSQSWGWRSSTLMLDEGLDDEVDDEGGKKKGTGMLRFSVVIGNL